MVVGLDRWRNHFADFQDRYVLVGGVACDQLMTEAGLSFRATKDLDVVLLVELLDAAFSDAFWAFIAAGGYELRERAEGGNLYRFTQPAKPDYPYMIELFSRAPEGLVLAEDNGLTPLPIDEAAASLSAILLDEAYYGYLQANSVMADGLPLLAEHALIPFKARAHVDLSRRKAAGEKVDRKDVRKHRSDVFKLLQMLPVGRVYALPETIRVDMSQFLDLVAADPDFDPKPFGLNITAAQALARLAAAYGLPA